MWLLQVKRSLRSLKETDVHIGTEFQQSGFHLSTMEASTSQAVSFVSFLHPANSLPFLDFPAYDYCPPNGGIHYGTAIAACEILACNYLSASRNRNDNGRVNVDWDTIIPSGDYYYHLEMETPGPLYPICQDFSCWEFPHKNLPSSWEHNLPKLAPFNWPASWSAISHTVKAQDAACLVSGWKDSLTVAHIVPQTQENWVCTSNSPSSQVYHSSICPAISWMITACYHTCSETIPSTKTSATSLRLGRIYALANLIREIL